MDTKTICLPCVLKAWNKSNNCYDRNDAFKSHQVAFGLLMYRALYSVVLARNEKYKDWYKIAKTHAQRHNTCSVFSEEIKWQHLWPITNLVSS